MSLVYYILQAKANAFPAIHAIIFGHCYNDVRCVSYIGMYVAR